MPMTCHRFVAVFCGNGRKKHRKNHLAGLGSTQTIEPVALLPRQPYLLSGRIIRPLRRPPSLLPDSDETEASLRRKRQNNLLSVISSAIYSVIRSVAVPPSPLGCHGTTVSLSGSPKPPTLSASCPPARLTTRGCSFSPTRWKKPDASMSKS